MPYRRLVDAVWTTCAQFVSGLVALVLLEAVFIMNGKSAVKGLRVLIKFDWEQVGMIIMADAVEVGGGG